MNKSGTCTCIEEPRGQRGLEGFVLFTRYTFEKRYSEKKQEEYYRVFTEDGEPAVCTKNAFHTFFKVKENNNG